MKTTAVPFHVIKNRNPQRMRNAAWPEIKPLGGPNSISPMADELQQQREDIARTFGTFKKDAAQ